MEVKNIDILSRKYRRQQLLLSVVLYSLGLIIDRVWFLDRLIWPLVVSVVFTLVVSYVSCFFWRRVAKQAPGSLPTFYTASSGFRLAWIGCDVCILSGSRPSCNVDVRSRVYGVLLCFASPSFCFFCTSDE